MNNHDQTVIILWESISVNMYCISNNEGYISALLRDIPQPTENEKCETIILKINLNILQNKQKQTKPH